MPANVALKLTPSNVNAGTGTTLTFDSTTTKFSNVALISGIAKYTNSATATVGYSVQATSGFDSFGGTLTYTIGTGF
ncbi:hypothetical protein ACFSC4_24735 [Deinococcus malanensis]